jgi:SMP-30/Gluconolactonase/LRE-like region
MFGRVEARREHQSPHNDRRAPNVFIFILLSTVLMISAGCVISPRRIVGGGGATPTPTGSPTPTPPAGAAGKLYVTNINNNSILRFDNASSANGNLGPAAIISGASTQIISPQHIFVDGAADRLFVANQGNVLIFDSASTRNGNVAPSRSISGAATGIASPVDVAVDDVRDLLYVADTRDVFVYTSPSTVNGNAPFGHDIQAGFIISAMYLDSGNDRLYLADSAANAINVYDGASGLNGRVAPSRSITGASTQLNQPSGLAVDAVNKLIVANAGSNTITVYINAAAANANASPAFVITGASTTLNGPSQIAVNRSSTLVELFVANTSGANVPVFSDLGSRSGNINPSRNIAGSSTTFSAGGVRGITLDSTR